MKYLRRRCTSKSLNLQFRWNSIYRESWVIFAGKVDDFTGTGQEWQTANLIPVASHKIFKMSGINRQSLHKITPNTVPFLPLCKHWTHPSLSLSSSLPSGPTVKDDSGENGMPLAFLISAFCHSLSIVSRHRPRHVRNGKFAERKKRRGVLARSSHAMQSNYLPRDRN